MWQLWFVQGARNSDLMHSWLRRYNGENRRFKNWKRYFLVFELTQKISIRLISIVYQHLHKTLIWRNFATRIIRHFHPHSQTEPTPLYGEGLVSLNAFGFGGSNAHVILLPNEKEKNIPNTDVFFVNGRTADAVSNLIDLARREPKKGMCLESWSIT